MRWEFVLDAASRGDLLAAALIATLTALKTCPKYKSMDSIREIYESLFMKPKVMVAK